LAAAQHFGMAQCVKGVFRTNYLVVG